MGYGVHHGWTWGLAAPYPSPQAFGAWLFATLAPRFVSQKVMALQSRHELCSFGGVGRFSSLDG